MVPTLAYDGRRGGNRPEHMRKEERNKWPRGVGLRVYAVVPCQHIPA